MRAGSAISPSVYKKVGDVQCAQGDLSGALKSYRDSLGIVRSLPSRTRAMRTGRAISPIATKRRRRAERSGRSARRAQELPRQPWNPEKLAKQDPGNADWQRDLSVSYSRVGDVQSAQGDLSGALKSYRDGLHICQRLAKQDPRQCGWQRDLSGATQESARCRALRATWQARSRATATALIFQKLAKQDPGNADWQRDLSVSYIEVGNVQSEQGDLSGALKSYRDSLGILEKLAKQDPGNAVGSAISPRATLESATCRALRAT